MPALLPRHRAHDAAALLTAWQRVARLSKMHITPLAEVEGLPIFALESKAAVRGERTVYLSAGVHGDEPGAAWGLLAWAEAHLDLLRREAFLICPCLNPVGLARNTRVDYRGLDLNRRFHLPRDPICGPWQRLVKPRKLSLGLCLHEDYDGQGSYIYQLSADARALHADLALTASASHIPRDPRTNIDGHRAKNGVLHRRIIPSDIVGPEAIVLYHLGCPTTLTVETPSEFSLDDRVLAQQSCIEATLEHYFQHRSL